jgi:hypothetical protein
MPDAYGAGIPETQIFHEQLFVFFSGDSLPLKVAVTDPAGVSEVRCYFRFDHSAPFVYSIMVSAGDHEFTTQLPAATSTVKDIEYLFLVVNGRKQAILSPMFAVNTMDVQKGYADGAQNRVSARYQLKSEVERADTVKKFFLQPANVDISRVRQQDYYGVLAGLYSREQIGSEVGEGYFGVFRFDSTKKMTAVKGNIVTGRASDYSLSQEKSITEKETATAEEITTPDISGDDWTGYFWRSDFFAGTVKAVTATVTQTKDGVLTITTSKDGLAHYFEGNIDVTGNILVLDPYDNQLWSTHEGPVTDVYIKIEDYVETPTLENPDPPLYIIKLTRGPRPIRKFPSAAISLLLSGLR